MKKQSGPFKTPIGALFSVGKIPMNSALEVSVDQKQEWVQELLGELNENAPEKEREGELNLDLSLERLGTGKTKDQVIIQGQAWGEYFTSCIRCLETMPHDLQLEFQCSLVPEEMKDHPEYRDQDTVLWNNEELDLYFYLPSDEVNLKELVRERVFLALDHFPLHAEDCKGLCQSCGHNLNLGPCSHQKNA